MTTEPRRTDETRDYIARQVKLIVLMARLEAVKRSTIRIGTYKQTPTSTSRPVD